MKVADHTKDRTEPKGGWLGPCTTGWTDLREIDQPGHLRRTKRPRAA